MASRRFSMEASSASAGVTRQPSATEAQSTVFKLIVLTQVRNIVVMKDAAAFAVGYRRFRSKPRGAALILENDEAVLFEDGESGVALKEFLEIGGARLCVFDKTNGIDDRRVAVVGEDAHDMHARLDLRVGVVDDAECG